MSIKEIIQRNEITSLLLQAGYNIFLPVSDQGIDFIALDEATGDLKLVQQKSRWTIDKKYIARDIWIAFKSRAEWFLAPHDWMVSNAGAAVDTQSWKEGGAYSRAHMPVSWQAIYAPYRVTASEAAK